MIKVTNEINVYEVDGKDVPLNEKREIQVESHWNRRELVILVIDDKKYTISVKDLEAAIRNASNTVPY